MDYEKKYNKALEIIKGNLDALNEITETGATVVNIQSIRNCFYRAFPELKESEDERIRKWLEGLIEAMSDNSIEFKDVRRIDVLHWLEKQGEKPKWTEEDVIRLDRICKTLWKNRKGDIDEKYQQEKDVDWLKSLKERME